jgi:hypothetical protein
MPRDSVEDEMIGSTAKTKFDAKKVLRAARRANIRSIGHAGAYVRKIARHSIRKSSNPSAPGKPPHTRRGQLRRSILYAVDKDRQGVVIGPRESLVGTSATAHEFGGQYRGQRYDRRPFMGPALEKASPKLPRMWAASVR